MRSSYDKAFNFSRGLFTLIGSQQFGSMARIGQSLAGRVGRLELLPFSAAELAAARRLPADLDTLLWQGGYPPLYDRPLSPNDWFPNYIATLSGTRCPAVDPGP